MDDNDCESDDDDSIDVDNVSFSYTIGGPLVDVPSARIEIATMNDKVKAFVIALRSSRREHRWTQQQAGVKLGIARPRYNELEHGRMPTRNLQPHYAFVLFGFSPTVAALFAAAVGRPLEQLIVHVHAGPAMLDAKAARPVVLAAIYKAAEDHDVPPTTLRRVAADVFEQLAEAGVSLQQALEITRAAVNESGKAAAKRAKPDA